MLDDNVKIDILVNGFGGAISPCQLRLRDCPSDILGPVVNLFLRNEVSIYLEPHVESEEDST